MALTHLKNAYADNLAMEELIPTIWWVDGSMVGFDAENMEYSLQQQ